MRRALLVGIDHYESSPLTGCVNDATKLAAILSRNADGSPNFQCRTVTSKSEKVSRAVLRRDIEALFDCNCDVVFFFFAGHGTVNNLGGYLVTQDAQRYDEGVAMADVLTFANRSRAKERIIVLDCCHSGALGQLPALANDQAVISEGVTVLSACRQTEYAVEQDGGGAFTGLVYDALDGGAADILGKVTVASIYAYVDQTFGPWEQRPLFKSHVSRLAPLRTCKSAVPIEDIRLLPSLFDVADRELRLDPSFEPTVDPRNTDNERIMRILQRFHAAHLVEPVMAEHMYYAAIESKSCRLTPLGQFYWRLANSGQV